MKWFRRAAAVCCAAMLTVPAAAEWIIDTEAGDTVQSLLQEDAQTWVPAENAVPAQATALEIGGKSALLMELGSGQVLFEKNAGARLPIASVTKVMTMLLIMEAVEDRIIDLEDVLTCSDTAASMGGSQIWLEPGETMTVRDLLKAIAVVSANDACTMVAEHICGSVESFVQQMNTRAAELGMKDTQFLDACGLNDAAYSSAYDVALMSRELMKHGQIKEFTTIWMDTLREGQSQLVNTNRLIRHYPGATGLKTGTTSTAGHNLSATAEREGMGFVAVILGCTTTAERFGGAQKMLDFGFANFAVAKPEVDKTLILPVKVLRGMESRVGTYAAYMQPLLVRKGQEKQLAVTVELAADVEAPVLKDQVLGKLVVKLEDEVVAEYDIRAAHEVARVSYGAMLRRLWGALIRG